MSDARSAVDGGAVSVGDGKELAPRVVDGCRYILYTFRQSVSRKLRKTAMNPCLKHSQTAPVY